MICNVCKTDKDEECFKILTENQVKPRRCKICKECGSIILQQNLAFKRVLKELKELRRLVFKLR